ncbi:uncharacterized protein LOC133914370 [Phragmites australis]|uniref:uncharacterized protein LOC133914370 n=1 Tax=Phragmites australis TaxID=29695 RepID=UPI002D78A7DD|nr:uncharacterized protein LOC133914370 [Phragmites australis]
MEDSVGEEERREQEKTVAQAGARQEGVEASGGGEPGEDGGFLSAVASKIGAAMSGTNDSGGEVNVTAPSNGEEKEKEDGNGGGGIFHKLLSSSPPASSLASGAMETEEVNGEEKDQDAVGEQAGILSAMASKIGMTMSGANGNGNHNSEDDAKMSNGDAVDGSKGEEKEKGDEANGGGSLSAMATKIGMAMSGANGDGNHGGSGDDAKTSNGEAVHGSKGAEEGHEANGGGILGVVASKISMAVSGTNGNGNHNSEDDAKTSNGEAVHGSKSEEKKGVEGNGGGLVEQIISNLPSGDQAPDADEASLLIAIIED